jgi:hypothetical protein
MTGFISSLPESDPRRIFWNQEDDIHSLVEYVALLVAITKRSPMEMDEDEQSGLHRLVLEVQDHALSLREAFRQAFSPEPEQTA